MSDELNKHRIPYSFLQDMRDRFVAANGWEEPLQAIAFCYNEAFSKVLQERMEFYNAPDADLQIGDSIGAVKSQIEDVKSVMVQNIEKVLERGEKIELLVDKTDRLNQQAFRFESSSRSLRRTMYWRKIRCYIGIGVAVAFLLFVASATLCGGFDYRHCRLRSSSGKP
jgi:vesicle-associated membrane protein 7